MRKFLFATGTVALAALTAGCGSYYDRTNYAYAPGSYYGNRYYDGYTYRTYPSTAYAYPSTAYAYQSNPYPSTTGYYYSQGDYYRNYRGIHSPPERNM
jgi:hypothetical protein